jgi:hypothetical protein
MVTKGSILLILLYTVSKLEDNIREIYRYLKRYWRLKLIAGFIAEAFLLGWIIIGSIFVFKLGPDLISFTIAFFLVSGIMRVCWEMTSLTYEEEFSKVIKFYRDFSRVRLAFYLTPLLMFSLNVPGNTVLSLINLVLLFLTIILFTWHVPPPILQFLFKPERLKVRIKILRLLYPDNRFSVQRIIENLNLNEVEVKFALNQLEKEKYVELANRKYQLSKRVKLYIK